MRSLLPSGAAWTGALYGRFRFVLGLYLFIHFAHLSPWAAEIFSSAGVLPDAGLSPFSRLFPNLLAVHDGPAFVTLFVNVAALVSAAFALGIKDRAGGLFLAYALACLFGRNPLIANPSLPYIGWLLVAHAFMPRLDRGVGLWRQQSEPWRFPPGIHAAAWLVLAAGYSFSGYTKLVSPSWLDGTAIARVLESPLARPGVVRDLLLGLPMPVLRMVSYSALGLELLFLPLAVVPALRQWIWVAMVIMHASLMALISFADLSVAMILVHLFVADPRWLEAIRSFQSRLRRRATA